MAMTRNKDLHKPVVSRKNSTGIPEVANKHHTDMKQQCLSNLTGNGMNSGRAAGYVWPRLPLRDAGVALASGACVREREKYCTLCTLDSNAAIHRHTGLVLALGTVGPRPSRLSLLLKMGGSHSLGTGSSSSACLMACGLRRAGHAHAWFRQKGGLMQEVRGIWPKDGLRVGGHAPAMCPLLLCSRPHCPIMKLAYSGARKLQQQSTLQCCTCPRERERERESLHLSSHTGLMQVLPGHPLADTITECSVTV